MCYTWNYQEGIDFARISRNWDIEERERDSKEGEDNIIEHNLWDSEHYKLIQAKLTTPQYKRIKIGIDLLIRSLNTIQNTWRQVKRNLLIIELTNNIYRQHEIEIEADKVNDYLLRQYIYDQLDDISIIRRSISEEIKWDIEVNRNS